VADAKPLAAALEALRLRLEDEEASYADALAELDRQAGLPLPDETGPEIRELLQELNQLWTAPPGPSGRGLGGVLERRAWNALAPAHERQARFNAVLVRLMNAQLEHASRSRAWSPWSTRATTCGSRGHPPKRSRCSRSTPAGSRPWA
jgi:hypothetical protein